MVESSYTIGVKQGMITGEKQKAVEIPENLIDVLDTETIAAKTGLTVEEVDTLKQN